MDKMEARQISDYWRNDTQAPLLLSLSGSFLLLAIFLIGARLWSRLQPVQKLKATDWALLVAAVRDNRFIELSDRIR